MTPHVPRIAPPTSKALATTVALAAVLGLACGRQAPAPSPLGATKPVVGAPVDGAPSDGAAVAEKAPPRARPTFALFYTSDLRGRMTAHEAPLHLPPGVTLVPLARRESSGGLARRATIVDRARVAAGGVVQVDAGDFLPLPTDEPRDAVAPAPKDAPRWLDLVLAGYRRLGVDAVTLGERELGSVHAGLDPKRLAKRLAAAHVPVVLANLTDRKHASVFPASAIVDAGGVKVGVLGVTELPADATAALEKAGYVVTPPDEAARAAAADLRARGATFVVALVHAAAGRGRAAQIAGGADADVAVLALGHEAAHEATHEAAPDAGHATDHQTNREATGAAARPLLLAAGGDMSVGRLDVRLAPGRPPAFDDAVVDLAKDVPEQLGVGLLSRLARIPLTDSDKTLADAERKHIHVKMNDLYEIWDYGSTKACGYCHPKTVEQWTTTDHAHAFSTLVRAKHDKDPSCVGCHIVGFLQTGGTRDMTMVRGQFADVGCESCHGPSAAHVRAIDKKQGTVRAVGPVVCLGCHTPDQNVGAFDPVAAMQEILGPGHGMPDKPANAATKPQ
ncbi:MAG TPA: multiheme c-type cytochrome [Polyangia bacterium]|jgi:hypothetical protein|nr:multiheme c-type cytochrome [Polyangia bacterium]